MSINDFVIPLDNDELVSTYFGNYSHRHIVLVQNINKEINGISQQQISERNAADLIEEKLDLLFSVIVHGNKLEMVIYLRVFDKVLKILQNLVAYLETKTEHSQELILEPNEKVKLLAANKICAYLVSTMMCVIEEVITKSNDNMDAGNKRGKKSVPKSDIAEQWDVEREKALETLYRWLQLPLKYLWTPTIVEDAFVGTVSQICYKILETTKDIKSKTVRNLIFQILGTLVKRYNHGIACVVRIIQLAKFHEALAAPIGAGIVVMVTDCGCTGLIKEIAKEIQESEPGEADARNFSNFLEAITSANAEIVLPIINNITDYLGNECYVMRNCAIGVMGIIITNVLTGENLSAEKRSIRDECLDYLIEHMLDCNAYVRSKVLQTWQKLRCEGAIPVSRENSLLTETINRLQDKSANVRKQALQLLRAILQGNPFASEMNREKISQNLEQQKAELKKLQTEVYHTVGAKEEKEELWNTQLPLIEKAIDKLTEEDRNHVEAENDYVDEEIDIKETFDKIQTYILKDKCTKAVKYLQKLFIQSGFAKEMENVSEETKKEAFLLFMYKIFVNSSSKEDNDNNEENKKCLKTDQEELKKLDEIKKKKKLVDYFQNWYTFTIEMEKTIPIAQKLLYSMNPGDAIEACSFLGAAYQFKVAGALDGVRKALFQIFCRDQSVKDNLTIVYKEIYLDSNSQQSPRARALLSVKSLIQLLDGMKPGQSTALAKLIVSWRQNGELDAEALKVMWEMFSLKLPNVTPEESRAALMLLTMAAEIEPNIITDNLDVLIKVGFGPRGHSDLLLARDTCRAGLAIKQDDSQDVDKSPIRYPNDHEMFNQISTLLKERFFDENENGYISFATDAINYIYCLADQPSKIVKDILIHIDKIGKFSSTSGHYNKSMHTTFEVSRMLYLIGHFAIREMVHLDQSIYKELKRRNAVREKNKMQKNQGRGKGSKRKSMNVSTMSVASNVSVPGSAHRSIRNNKIDEDQEDGMEGATADDADAEHINMCLESELLSEHSLLSKLVPVILEICQHPEIYTNKQVQVHAVLALGKFMTISSKFCETNLQLFVTILERSPYPQIRSNILIGLADLMMRFPNEIEPWTSHIYGRLKDENLEVRSTCVCMLSNLILGEMIRVKGQVAQLALCMVDEDETIRTDAKQLFKDLSQKGNALYNVMPDILSCLSDPELNLSEKNFQDIIKYILGLLQKDRQVDSIIEKLCSRFKLATTERQWRDLSYCLSLLKFSSKGIRILIKELPLLKDKIHNDSVQQALKCIVDQAKRRPEAKTACIELEDKIKELLENTENAEEGKPLSDSEVMPPPSKPVPKSVKAKKTRRTRKQSDDEDEDDDDYEEKSNSSRISSRRNTRRGRSESIDNSLNDTESEEDESISKTPKGTRRSNRTLNLQNTNTPVSSITPSKSLRKRKDSVERTPTSTKKTRATRR